MNVFDTNLEALSQVERASACNAVSRVRALAIGLIAGASGHLEKEERRTKSWEASGRRRDF